MSIIYVHGDLLESDCDVIAHGCNCFHSFGAGIACQFLKRYPESFEADLSSEREALSKSLEHSHTQSQRQER